MLKLIHTERPITEDEFHIFESRFIDKIPESFKNHYLRENGGLVSIKYRIARKSDLILLVRNFFPIKYGNFTIEKLVESLEDLIPNEPEIYPEFTWRRYEFIPFAESEGLILFMSLKNNDYGSIHVYLEEKATCYGLFLSFDEFIKDFHMAV